MQDFIHSYNQTLLLPALHVLLDWFVQEGIRICSFKNNSGEIRLHLL